MTEEPSLTAIDRELVRIGFDEDELPALVLPTGVSLGDLLTMLQALPTGAGPEAFEQLMLSLRWPVQAPWDDWPDPGERFSVSDYVAALRLVNFSPLEVAEEYAAPPRHVPTWILAALSVASPGLERSVAEYLSETRRDRLAAGISPEVIDMADEQFERSRNVLTKLLDAVEEQKLERNGPAILFRLGPEMSREQCTEFFWHQVPEEFRRRRAWLANSDAGGTWGCFFLTKNASASERARLRHWLGQPSVREIRLARSWVWDWPPTSSP